jgi:hypothetical protein
MSRYGCGFVAAKAGVLNGAMSGRVQRPTNRAHRATFCRHKGLDEPIPISGILAAAARHLKMIGAIQGGAAFG